jgi:hypothetical protein
VLCVPKGTPLAELNSEGKLIRYDDYGVKTTVVETDLKPLYGVLLKAYIYDVIQKHPERVRTRKDLALHIFGEEDAEKILANSHMGSWIYLAYSDWKTKYFRKVYQALKISTKGDIGQLRAYLHSRIADSHVFSQTVETIFEQQDILETIKEVGYKDEDFVTMKKTDLLSVQQLKTMHTTKQTLEAHYEKNDTSIPSLGLTFKDYKKPTSFNSYVRYVYKHYRGG